MGRFPPSWPRGCRAPEGHGRGGEESPGNRVSRRKEVEAADERNLGNVFVARATRERGGRMKTQRQQRNW